LAAEDAARERMKRNIDAWWPQIEQGVEALVVTASGCGAMVRDYGELLRDDPAYARKAARVSEIFRDISQVVAQELARPGAMPDLGTRARADRRVAFHSPCTLQHGLKLRGVIEPLLERVGYSLTSVADGHLCCGSAGTYSLLQPAISRQLKTNKLAALQADAPDVIATANIGCLMHLASGTDRPVLHWIELLAQAI
jgi:glycolate oxidase iron-sulfur subunit